MLAPRLVAVIAASLVVAAPAAAADLTQAELRSLAHDAATNPAALEELENADTVDGRPVDLRRALEGADERERARRLEALAESSTEQSGSSGPKAQAQARGVLADPKFHATTVPRPLHGPLDWLGRKVGAVVDALPGGPNLVWTLLAGLLVAVAAFFALRIASRRAALAVEPRGRRHHTRDLSPEELERAADEAEARGDFEQALRLRFLAGLVRLDRTRAIGLRDSLTTGDLRRRLRSDDFDRLARRFDEIVYGERPARREDVEESKADWQRVLAVVQA